MLATLGAAAPGSLELDFAGLRSATGLIRICLTTSPKGFPDCKADPSAITRTLGAEQHNTRFDALPAGDYAVSVIHDENANARLDTFAGIPREGFGFSRNPVITFGPPSFKAARFAIAATPVKQTVRLRYFL
ncbi:DUF2141 domain-containing protein [Sphingomonas sp. LaA6.9]|uniref:DUF2141 domain-containing protein n=1 Tax=Sphingomonas sp. LaA6.9 TaxID=2919914 RepID=UPI001F4F12DB|nr:DUF2141 domain-containing protein [Sphingomonas sp. LaA6.9]MCJ8159827.1 DUF2141 domain-containing protein [Sphingomonas sp. LaA6.9]